MGLEMESDQEKNSSVGLSPNTVLPLKQSSKRASKNGVKYSRRDELLVLKEDFREISLSRYHRSVSCKTAPPRRASRELRVEDLRRGSIYQTSREVRRLKEMGVSEEGRRKIEISSRSDMSFSIVDSLCRDEDRLKRRSLDPRPIPEPAAKASAPLEEGFFEIRLDPSTRGSENSAKKDLNPKSDCVIPGPPESDSNELLERDVIRPLNKSVSKTRFSPIRKIMDPFVKSKSSRTSPLSHSVENSPLNESVENVKWTEKINPSVSSSPVHLQGFLKLENKKGSPFFEFSLQCPEEVFIAKTHRAREGCNWVYTFHSVDNGKKSNASSDYHSNSSSSTSSMVGQMQVSSYLCSELKEGAFENSMVTEFVLNDVSSPSVEIAAVVMQAPFEERRESLKRYDVLDLSAVEAEPRRANLDRVKVVIPAGNHGHPDPSESGPHGSPSPLIDRWRSGGGCDCGGWDMGCPLAVLGNPHFRSGNSQSFVESQLPMELFLQGSKDDTPALTMTTVEEGLFAVNFHAQLSTLQAFSVCVAILHGTETSAEERDTRTSPQKGNSSLKALIEEEVKLLIEAVAAEKDNVAKRVKEIPPSYVINPPFSPIARV